MAGRFVGKVAIVTGAGSGIGEVTAEAFHAEGARVLLADVSGRQEDVAERLGEGVLPVHVDVSKAAEVENMVARAVAAFGGLDILFNNAGLQGRMGSIAGASVDVWNEMIGVNLTGPFLGMRYAFPAMIDRGGGSIVTTSSIAQQTAFTDQADYCASKGGLAMLTKTAALEGARHGIRVNAVLPGVTDTPMCRSSPPEVVEAIKAASPQGRLASPSEIAAVVLFLCSGDSSYVTGQSVVVDGGSTLGV